MSDQTAWVLVDVPLPITAVMIKIDFRAQCFINFLIAAGLLSNSFKNNKQGLSRWITV